MNFGKCSPQLAPHSGRFDGVTPPGGYMKELQLPGDFICYSALNATKKRLELDIYFSNNKKCLIF